jgi:hypothetical protein
MTRGAQAGTAGRTRIISIDGALPDGQCEPGLGGRRERNCPLLHYFGAVTLFTKKTASPQTERRTPGRTRFLRNAPAVHSLEQIASMVTTYLSQRLLNFVEHGGDRI